MGQRLAALLAVLVGAGMFAAASAPAAAVGVGWRCDPNATVAGQTFLAATKPEISSVEAVVPWDADAVITGWEVDSVHELGPTAQRLEVYEARNEANQYAKVGESNMEMLKGRGNTFDTRIPVDGGESVGLWGPNGTLVCNQEDGATSLRSDGGGALGETKAFVSEAGIGTPAVAWVERDADHDGFGDETQDRCPDRRSIGRDCPISLKVWDTTVKRCAITLAVTPDADTRIHVRGEVLWYARQEGKDAANQGERRLVGVKLSGGERVVQRGRTARFSVPLREPLLGRLRRLSASRSILARLEIFFIEGDTLERERKHHVPLWGRKGLGSRK